MIECRNLLQKEVSRKEEVLKGFLEDKQIPKALRVAAKEAYSYYIKMRPSLSETGLYDELPSGLAYRLVEHMFQKEISHVALFQSISDRAFIARLVVHSRPFQAGFGDVVYEEKGVAECMSFLIRGSVRLTTSAGGQRDSLLGYATAGNFFGDFEFYRRSLRVAKYQSVRNSSLYSIDYAHIQEAVDEHLEAGAVFTSALKQRYQTFLEVLKGMQKPIPASMFNRKPTMVRRVSSSVFSRGGSRKGSRASSRKVSLAGSRKPSVVPNSTSRKRSLPFYFGLSSSAGSMREPPESARGLGLDMPRTMSGHLDGAMGPSVRHGSAASDKRPSDAPPAVTASTVAAALDALAAGEGSKAQTPPSVDGNGRRRRALLGTAPKQDTARRASRDIDVALKHSPHHVTFWVDGNKVVNESADDAAATEAVLNFNLSTKAPETLFPCVVRTTLIGRRTGDASPPLMHLHTSTPPHLHTSTPPHLHTSTPPHLHPSTPPHLHTSTPPHLHTCFLALLRWTIPATATRCSPSTTGRTSPRGGGCTPATAGGRCGSVA